MPRKAHKWVGYAGYLHITAQTLVEAQRLYGKEVDQMSHIEALVDEGYTFTISPKIQPKETTYIAKLTGSFSGYNKGLTLSSFAGNACTAVALTLYKHLEICDGAEWPEGKQSDFG